MASDVAAHPDRERFSGELAALNMSPLWERVMRIEPGTSAVPARLIFPSLADPVPLGGRNAD